MVRPGEFATNPSSLSSRIRHYELLARISVVDCAAAQPTMAKIINLVRFASSSHERPRRLG
jgi:hypothetical protein